MRTGGVGDQGQGLSSGRGGHETVGDGVRVDSLSDDNVVCEDGAESGSVESSGYRCDSSEGSLRGSEDGDTDGVVESSGKVGGSDCGGEGSQTSGGSGGSDADGDAVREERQ